MVKQENKTTKNVANENVKVNNQENETSAKVEEPVKEESKKVDAKAAIKSITKVAKLIRAERIGINATIRLLIESVENGNEDARNVICALLDIPTDLVHSVTVEHIRNAVNDYYPYIGVIGERRINVKIKSVYYTTAHDTQGKDIEKAVHMVTTGYYAIQANDYLQILTSAAKARAKGIKQKQLDSEAVYKSKDFAEVDKNVTVTELIAAANNREYKHDGVTVWRKHSLFGYYI